MSEEEGIVERLAAATRSSEDASKSNLEELRKESINFADSFYRRYLEQVLSENSTTLINIKNVQIMNSQSFRSGFLSKQLGPLLSKNLVTLETFLNSIDKASHNLRKSQVVDNMIVSIHPLPKSLFSRNMLSIDVIPMFNIIPSRKFTAKTGTNIGNGEGDGYIQFQLRNIFGGAEGLVFDAVSGTRTQSSYLVNYSQPILNSLDYMVENLAFSYLRKLDWIQSEAGVKGMINKVYTQFSLPFNHEIAIENVWRTLSNNRSKSFDVLSQLGHNLKSSFTYNFKYDTRDNLHLPFSGNLFRLGLEYGSLLSKAPSKYLKGLLEMQCARRINDCNSLIFSTRAGLIYSLEGTSHVLDRFYIGGPNDVRSFVLNGLGPKDYGSSIGGDAFLNGGVSLVSRFPLLKNDSNFKLHNFVNFGNLVPFDQGRFSNNIIQDLTSRTSISYGFGVLYNHPMARLELNLVLPLVAHERDYMRKGLQYGIGVSFL